MKTIVSILIVGCIFLFNACKSKDCKDDGSCPPEYYIYRLGDAKDYLWAKPGSYWIYKNTLTGDLDTQTVTEFSFDTIISKGTLDNKKYITIEYEMLSRSIFSSFNQWIYTDQTSKYSADYFREQQTILDRYGGTSTNMPFFHPFVYNVKGNNRSIPTLQSIDSVFLLNGKSYYSVVKFDIDIDDIWEIKLNCIRPNSLYYWAKDVGLIKKEMNRCGYSWELIDYRILK